MWIDPRRHPDFGWAWLTRFLVNVGNALGTLHLLYFLDDAVGYHDPETGLIVLMVIYTVALLATAVLVGSWSDRVGLRKPFVIASGAVMAGAALVLVFAQTWSAAIVAAVLLGAGFGVYLAVDFALITQVLPTARDRAKDLGVVNIAAPLPQVFAPAIAAPVILHLGGYATLYLLAALFNLVGGVLVYKIRSVARRRRRR